MSAPILKVSSDDIRDLKAVIEALAKLVDEGSIKFTPEKMEIIALDRAHISLLQISFPKEMFKEYEVQNEYNFGFNAQYLLKLLKASKRKEAYELSAESNESITLKIIGSLVKEFNIRNLEVVPPEVPEINLEFDINALITSSGFKKAVQQVAAVSDTIDIQATEEKIIIKSEGEEKVEIEFSKESGGLQSIEATKEALSSYTADYLVDVLSLTKLSDTVGIAFSEKKPLKLEYNVEGGGKVTYLIAPKIT
ncbi:MAG: DNA polymerase sliding clamp [Sulfolobaceae archaeon]|nr:DNA polymerase sliding clamp [Sulfolobaceae archaeon]